MSVATLATRQVEAFLGAHLPQDHLAQVNPQRLLNEGAGRKSVVPQAPVLRSMEQATEMRMLWP